MQDNKSSFGKSSLGKNWILRSVSERQIHSLRQHQEISEILARLLAIKNIDIDGVESFLNPKLRDLLPDPFHLLGMEEGVLRAMRAIYNKEKICIFGDYDVDGATSSALLKRFFKDLGIDIEIYIPDRILEGYGPSVQAMEKIKNSGTKLIITVDCGASSFEALSYAKAIGLDVIVIDHHMMGDKMPEADAVINPNRLDETTEYRYLAAVGVCFIFIVGLCTRLREAKFFDHLKEPKLMQYLDLVALGTVCDVMPLTGLNRAFVAQGLKIMSKRENVGLRVLSDMARLNSAPTAYHLGFMIGPRINAGGRVGKSDLGSRLLSTSDQDTAYNIALMLEQYNAERKEIEQGVLEEATASAELMPSSSMIMVAGEGWHPGVIGIVAGRLKEKYQKPVAVIALNDGVGKASCRSVKGVDFGGKVVEAKMRGLLEEGGGHAMAAGFTVKEEHIAELKEFFELVMHKEYQAFVQTRSSEYDIEITTSGLTLDLLKEMQQLAPFGSGNPEPMIRVDDLYVISAQIVGEKHVSCLLAPSRTAYGSKALKAIAFNAVESPLGGVLLSHKKDKIAIIGHAQINEWNQTENVQFILSDIIVGVN
ncbi:MAG: single-stranded-DNA-specific exonuclease RecJ [Pseudomonadota bacterium]